MLGTGFTLWFLLTPWTPTAWLGPLRGDQEIAQQSHDFGSLDSNLFSKSTRRCGWAWVCSSLSPFGAWPPLSFVIQSPPPCSLPGVRRPLPNPHGVQSPAGSWCYQVRPRKPNRGQAEEERRGGGGIRAGWAGPRGTGRS